MNQEYSFKSVTLLVTHYNRSSSLDKLLNSFIIQGCSFEEIIVSDDGSSEKHKLHLQTLQHKYGFKLITTKLNKGLGNNINKGQDAVNTPYTLYIQEDFLVKEAFAENLKNALKIMDDDKIWDLITLYSYGSYPYLKPYKLGFSEKIFHYAPWYTNNTKFYLYGDHPHLRKSSFLQDFGRYKEGINGDETEMQMSLSFIINGGRSLIYNDNYGLLTQENSESEPSTATFRKSWRISNNFFIILIKWFYKKIKFIKLNFQLLSAHRIKKY